MNLAFLWGAKRIVLLGFDMQVAVDGASHWFGDHPKGQGFENPKKFNSWIRHMEILGRDLSDAGVDVYNASRQTALTCFAQTTIDRLPD